MQETAELAGFLSLEKSVRDQNMREVILKIGAEGIVKTCSAFLSKNEKLNADIGITAAQPGRRYALSPTQS